MKGYNKRNQKLLHYHLSRNKYLSEEQFRALTSLTDYEVSCWLSQSKKNIKECVLTCGAVLEYQRRRVEPNSGNLNLLRNRLGQNLYLWSDTVGFVNIPSMPSTLLSGLVLLSHHNRKLAIVWSILLGLQIPEETIGINYPYRFSGLMSRILKLPMC